MLALLSPRVRVPVLSVLTLGLLACSAPAPPPESGDCIRPSCTTAGCADGIDNDGDGWTDGDDPDCASGDQETGLGATTCNDGADNDGDGAIDAQDEQCTAGVDDEVTGAFGCVDQCLHGERRPDAVCALWDDRARAFVDGLDQSLLHNRARAYVSFLRQKLMPEGGIFRTRFSDTRFETPIRYQGSRDAPIWTGTFTAAEALRYKTTGSPDALAEVARGVQTLHRWWRITGSRGALARFAAPLTADPVTLALLPTSDDEVVDTRWQGEAWRWRGNISRDQYQGAFLGYSLAYEVLEDDALREAIREDVVETVEQLMDRHTVVLPIVVNGFPLELELTVEGVIYSTAEGEPKLTIETSPFSLKDTGFLVFWPNPAEYARDVPGLGWLPNVPLRSQAVQLGGMFAVALQVTEGIPEYAHRRQQIQRYYDAHFDEWRRYAEDYQDTGICGSGYHGKNIAFTPAHNWARLEPDPSRRAKLQSRMLRDGMWPEVADHKNVWFAYIYAANKFPSDDVSDLVRLHTEQLGKFPAAPNVGTGVNLRGLYPVDDDCTEKPMSTEAVDVGDRIPSIFMWERNPWKLVAPPDPTLVFPGHDYLIAYWMGRDHGFIEDDAQDTCLIWRQDTAPQ